MNDSQFGSGILYRVTSSGTVFTAVSLASGDLFPDTGMVVGDYLIFRIRDQVCKPHGMRFHVGTAMAGVGITGTWEYRLADGTWAAFAGVTDATNGFQTAGTNLDVTWTVPTDWGTNETAINTITGGMWWRYIITAVTSYTEGGKLGGTTPAVTQVYDNAVSVDANHVYSSGTATSGSANSITDSGKAWTVDALMWRHVYIHTGTGAGQVRVVWKNTATTITVYYPWDTTPDSTSQYVVTANFEDLYQADVAGGWGVITKAGSHCYSFDSFLDIKAAAFGDCNAMVEFQRNYMWYVSGIPTATYQIHFGWRLPLIYGLNKAVWGNTIITNRDSCVDERGSGFVCGLTGNIYAHSAGNRYVQRFDQAFAAASGFIRHWFVFLGKYSIMDSFEGWRSVLFNQTSPSVSEVRALRVSFGHSGIENARAAFDGVQSYYNASLQLYVTGAINYTIPNLELGLGSYEQNSSSYVSPIQFFSYTGTTSRIVDLKPRFRPFNDVFSTVSTGYIYLANKIRALITDEYGNAIPNATLRISDSVANNGYKFLYFDASDDQITVPNATDNQLSGSTAFSVEAWVYGNSAGEISGGRILDKTGGGSVGYMLLNSAGVWSYTLYTGGFTRVSNTITAAYNAWHHIVGVWDGSTVKLYVNNTTSAANSATGAASDDSAQTLYIGNRSANDRTHYGGIRRIRLFRNKALSAADVATLFNSGDYIQDQASPVSGCTGEYNFTEGTGTTLADTSGNGNTATLGATTTAPTWRDTSTGVTANSVTATTGSAYAFLSGQAVTHTGTYSLSTQPTSATILRITVSNFNDISNSASNAGRIVISGTDANSNSISDSVLVEGIQNGVYYTKEEFLTVSTLGILVMGFGGTISIDRAGLIYPQQVDTDRWVAFDDITNTPISYNPFIIKVSAPGYEPVTIKKNIHEAQNLHIPLKRSEVHLCHQM